MELNELLGTILGAMNEILIAGTVIIALSLLLYNLTRNLRNRVARSSAVVLGCVVFTYICEAFIALNPTLEVEETALRMMWIGIAFVPSSLFHLSDALLATTGLPSRGRRRRIVRILYAISSIFLVTALFTDLMIIPEVEGSFVSLRAGSLFWIFLLFFIVICVVTVNNVNRARTRALSRSTQRRLAYLQASILTPAFGIFPYSLILNPGQESTLLVSILVNIANVVVIFMLIFLSYPLSFFGSDKPDRVVKVELLRFLLRGPGTGLLALGIIISTDQATRILGLRGEDFTPFAVVAAVLFWQWTIALALPWLERKLVYNEEDDEQFTRLQDLSDRMLSRNDLLQLVEATLEALCDYLRINVAFVISSSGSELSVVRAVGKLHFDEAALGEPTDKAREWIHEIWDTVNKDIPDHDVQTEDLSPDEHPQRHTQFIEAQDYVLTPVYTTRQINGSAQIIGVIGLKTTYEHIQSIADEELDLLQNFIQRIQQTLDDLILQIEIFAALEGLLPQISMTRSRAGALEFRPGHQHSLLPNLPPRDEIYEQVRAALKQYWGGPGITRSRLYELNIVQERMTETETPVHALRSVLEEAIEKQRPEGERTMLGVEWTVYNILDLRYIEGKKVREVTKRLSMSDADFYRKQRMAIEAVVDTLIEMEVAQQPDSDHV